MGWFEAVAEHVGEKRMSIKLLEAAHGPSFISAHDGGNATKGGVLQASAACPSDTGGTCSYYDCDATREAVCIDGRCLCSLDHCAADGKCVRKPPATKCVPWCDKKAKENGG